MPGYPLIDQSNDYLMARFDKAVLDAKPWCEAQQEVQESDDESSHDDGRSLEEMQLRRLEVMPQSMNSCLTYFTSRGHFNCSHMTAVVMHSRT